VKWPCKHLLFHFEERPIRAPSKEALATKKKRRRTNGSEDLPSVIATILVAGGSVVRLEQFPETGAIEWGSSLSLVDTLGEKFRERLIDGARVLELGCGGGLPGLFCAAMGGNVILTDEEEALKPAAWNAQATGYPQRVWKVVGGKAAGGVPVQPVDPDAREDLGRLAVGALVEELELVGDSLHYQKLHGNGPQTGVVAVRRFGGAMLLTRTDERPDKEGAQGSAIVAPFTWDGEDAVALRERAGGELDLVLVSDCVNAPLYGDSSEDLADSIDVLCGAATTVLMSNQRRLDDGWEEFVQRLRRNLMVDKISSRSYRGIEVVVYSARRHSPSEGFVDFINQRTERAIFQVAAGEELEPPAELRKQWPKNTAIA